MFTHYIFNSSLLLYPANAWFTPLGHFFFPDRANVSEIKNEL